MARAISPKTLFEKKFDEFDFEGIWGDVFGKPEKGGVWIIYGAEKNGKTLFALKLAEFLTKYENVWYISAEEGTGKEFQANAQRAKIDPASRKIKFSEYTEIEVVKERLSKRQAPKIVLFDNMTIYNDELKNGAFRRFTSEFPNTTMIFLAHEEKKEPYTATAKLAKKLAKIYIRIEGLTAFVAGRCPGGIMAINEKTAMLYHGSDIKNKIQK
ncbi:hypothetical protein [Flavobacterium sp. PL02]|uniref:hypothetical protein n=1 Tax=Flavobacterium sp. PL02 TaxID=3088354 RepID=UPI002B236318|nr:hypothetical protein [Flavobacterium sp. PL02]MEA9414372.1 hypothetical protein [Flavobacterium sp. PL02]